MGTIADDEFAVIVWDALLDAIPLELPAERPVPTNIDNEVVLKPAGGIMDLKTMSYLLRW